MMDFIDFSIQWHITSKCPNRCRHCYMFTPEYEEKLKNEMSFDEICLVLDNIKAFEDKYNVEILNYILTGGDPFCREDFYDILRELYTRGKNICILGIPERVTKDSIAKLLSHNVSTYQVSLDGMEMHHDYMRGKGSFTRTMNAISLLSESNISCSVMYTLGVENADDMFNLIDYLDSTNYKIRFVFDFLVYEGNAQEQKDKIFSADKAKDLLYKYHLKGLELSQKKSNIMLMEKPKFFNVMNHIETYKDGKEPEDDRYTFCGGCYVGLTCSCIDSDGTIYPCRRMPISIGNIKAKSFESLILEDPILKKFRRRDSFPECGGCKYFKICRGCAAVSYSIYKDPFKKIPFCFLEMPIAITEAAPGYDISNEEEMSLIRNTKVNATYQSFKKDKRNLISALLGKDTIG